MIKETGDIVLGVILLFMAMLITALGVAACIASSIINQRELNGDKEASDGSGEAIHKEEQRNDVTC